MFKFEKLVLGDLGWGDEFLLAALMTIQAVRTVKKHWLVGDE